MKKGFTLVELLAVIVILAVILVIAVPQINSVIKQTKKNSLASTAKLIASKAEEKEVENQALEQNEELSCASLVKLDNNYGSCTVSIVNGKGTVTLVGTGKFAGITCTGTKDNMTCTEGNVPEYVYSFGKVYEYTYAVKGGKTEECVSYLETNMKEIMINDWNYTEEQAQVEIEAVCSNSNDIYNDQTDPYSTNEWFAEEIEYGDFTYEDISSFVEKSRSDMISSPVENYAALNEDIFIRWPGSIVNFDKEDNPEVCILYGGNTNNDVNCFRQTTYEETLQSIANVFGKENCTGDGVQNLTLLDKILGIDSVYASLVEPFSASCSKNNFECGMIHGDLFCSKYGGPECDLNTLYCDRK